MKNKSYNNIHTIIKIYIYIYIYIYNEKKKKKENFYRNVVASEAENRKKNRKVY
jgi:hypothetical protein